MKQKQMKNHTFHKNRRLFEIHEMKRKEEKDLQKKIIKNVERKKLKCCFI